MNSPLSPEELSDLEDQFFTEQSAGLEKYETAMAELYKSGRYREFLAVVKQSKEFFSSFGPGGSEYYKNTWSDDPRVERAKKAVAMQKKYSDGISIDDACLEILSFIENNNPSYAGDVFKAFPSFPHDLTVKALSRLCKNKQVVKDYDSGGHKIYLLP